MLNILLISGSLNPESHSRALMREVEQCLRHPGVETIWVDMREWPLPFCDGDTAYDDPRVEELSVLIRRVDAVLVGVPVYNYDINAVLKNLVELTGSAWEDKLVGFLCAAGGRSSYMAVMSFGNDLMLDFRCLIIPRFIYAVDSDFTSRAGQVEVSGGAISDRVRHLAEETQKLAAALKES